MKALLLCFFSICLGWQVKAAISTTGAAECIIKKWDKKFYELACDPRTPNVTLRTPTEWVKKALGETKPSVGGHVELAMSQERLSGWMAMNKKALANADRTAIKEGKATR